MATEPRYVARAEADVGWRVWDRKLKRWWGNFFSEHPAAILAELNGDGRPDVLAQLARPSRSRPRATSQGSRGARPQERVLAAHERTFRRLAK